MSNQLCYYSFTITKLDGVKETVTYTTRSPTLAKLKAEKYAKEINGTVNPKFLICLTPPKPSDPEVKKLIQTAYFG
jgi:hypothetical protein